MVFVGDGRTRWSQTQTAYIAPIHVRGIAAKIEEGGNLDKHSIFGRAERVPGVVVSRRSILNRIVESNFPRIVDDVSKSFNKFVERTL